MQNYDPSSDHEAVERAADSLPASRSQLEETASHGPAVRHAKCRTELHEKFDKPSVVGDDVNRSRLDLVENLLVEVVEGV